jgi:hypothetical protein
LKGGLEIEIMVRNPIPLLDEKEPPRDDVERFLAMLRYDSMEKLRDLLNYWLKRNSIFTNLMRVLILVMQYFFVI